MSLCDKCVSGVLHEGTPQGREEIINGVKTYVATPKDDYPKNKVVLFLPDVFGVELVNNRLLADDFARNGFKVYLIDYFGGDAVPSDAFSANSKFDIRTWFPNHGQNVTRPYIDKVVEGLKKQRVTQFAATGYCFGARYAFDLAYDGVLNVVAVAHPSLLQVPSDLENFKNTNLPLLINSCEVDQQFTKEAQAQADKILGDGSRESDLYRREYFDGCEHGFAVRGDLSNPKVKAGKEGAFEATVKFFYKYF